PLECRDCTFQIRVRGHDDDGQIGVALLRFLEKLEPRLAWHADIAHDDLRRLIGERGERLARRSESLERDVLARERFLEHPPYRTVIVDDPNRFHAFTPPPSPSAPLPCSCTGRRMEKKVLPGTLSNVTVP